MSRQLFAAKISRELVRAAGSRPGRTALLRRPRAVLLGAAILGLALVVLVPAVVSG